MKKDTNFSKFFHKASSKEKKKVFKKVIKKATEEQINIMNKSKSKVKRVKRKIELPGKFLYLRTWESIKINKAYVCETKDGTIIDVILD